MAREYFREIGEGWWEVWNFEKKEYFRIKPPASTKGEAPVWMSVKIMRELDVFAEQREANTPAGHFVQVMDMYNEAWRPDLPETVKACLDAMFRMAKKEFESASLSKIRAKYADRGPAGHAAFDDNWLNYWNDSWAERRPNGKGWVVGNKEILQSLPADIPQPDRSTITRHRKRRLKELQS